MAKTRIIAKFHKTNLLTGSHSRRGGGAVLQLNKYGNVELSWLMFRTLTVIIYGVPSFRNFRVMNAFVT